MHGNVDNPSESRKTPFRKYLIRRSAGTFLAATFDAESLAQVEHKSNCEIIYQITIPQPWKTDLFACSFVFSLGMG